MGAYETALLQDRYGYSGGKYQELMGQIVDENYSKISESVLTTDKRRFQSNVDATLPKRDAKKFVLPDVSNMIRKSPTIRKAADRGELLGKTMREDLRKTIKRSLLEQNITTTTGKVSIKAIKNVEKNLNGYFEGYVKKVPKFGMPSNVHTIAVTESRSIINQIQHEYSSKMMVDNPGYKMKKKWVHNGGLSDEDRKGHERIDGQTKDLDKPFSIPVYIKKGGVYVFTGKWIQAMHPHAANLPVSEVIGCHCAAAYIILKSKKRLKKS